MSNIDLHIHSKEGSDGKFSIEKIFTAASRAEIKLLSITDHDSLEAQAKADELANKMGIKYLTGLELNISFSCSLYPDIKAVSLDLLGYNIDINNDVLLHKLKTLREFRQKRAAEIISNLNEVFRKEGLPEFTETDLHNIEETADGALGRPHIANYLIEKKIVTNREEAFDKYLVKCNMPKMCVTLEEASELIRNAGGKVFLAHPDNPRGTSLKKFSKKLEDQFEIISNSMKPYLDGIECWHSSHNQTAINAYCAYAKVNKFMVSGGSDCHQQPVIMGTVDIPDWVATQFGALL